MLKTFFISLLLLCCLGCSITLEIKPLHPREPLEPTRDLDNRGQDVYE